MYRRTGVEPGPSISICPRCHSPKEPSQSICSICNTRSCPNGHILSNTERICSRCNWVDRQMKSTSTLYSIGKPTTRTDAGSSQVTCPVCGNRIGAGTAQCSYCGNLLSAESEGFQATEDFGAPATTNAPMHKGAIVVHQETIGHHDTKRTYICPNCRNRIDKPAGGKCPYCGYVGTMQYDITRKQPQWAASQPPFTPSVAPRESLMQGSLVLPQQKPLEGAEAVPASVCPSCGTPNPADSRFCGTCGYKYSDGRKSRKILTVSTAERSDAAASAVPELFAPIYADEAVGGVGGEIAPRRTKQKAAPREKKVRGAKRESPGTRKFPLGLLMAIMVVAALIIALGIFVISREFRNPQPINTVPPVISDVTFNAAVDGSTIVRWTTDKASTSQIMICDPEGLCTWTDPDTTLVTSHSVNISDIKPGIQYHITIKSIDQYGNEAQFESERTFTGTGSTDSVPPKISQVSVSNITDIGFTVTWKTDESATSQVEYGTSTSYGSATTMNSQLTTSHSLTVNGLSSATLYYVRAVSKDAAGNSAKGEAAQPVQTLTAVPVGVAKGNRAPEIDLYDISGNKVQLSDLRGKIVVVNFWATWCGPCVAEMPFFQTVYADWSSDADLEILAVNKQENSDTVKPYIESAGYTYTVLLDPGTIVASYKVESIPTTYFIDTKGIIREVVVGSFSGTSEITAILNTMN